MRDRATPAFTLLEVLVCIAIVAIVIAILIPVGRGMIRRSESVACMSNMRNLIPVLNVYVQDKGYWPQEPQAIKDSGDEAAHEDFWINEFLPYGVSEKSWQCPTIRRLVSSADKDGRPRLHYTPTGFDSNAATPYKWSTQPWFVEIGNMHGKGAYICFPDGSIKTMNDLLPAGQ
jgi:prepilin-type N-terminal cleavage/methylation domain-containing protein